MARRNPPAKWVLPNVVDPPRICFQIDVPNEPQHLAAFRGAILSLAAAYKWQDDLAHTAKDVAAVWDDIYTKIRTCETPAGESQGITLEAFLSTQIRISPDDSCIIQMWCIDHWEDWYDPRGCIPGTIEQPTNGTPIEDGQCREWDVSLDGNGKWLLPVAVNVGDLISITDANGAWNDGTLGWNCINGFTYGFNACISTDPPDPSDPLQTVDHMRLILNIDGTWYDGYNTITAVNSGVTDGMVYFQANDSSLEGNTGRVSFHVKVCKQEPVVDTISITYPFGLGIGPATINPGDTFAVIAVDNGGGGHNWYVDLEFSREVRVTVVSVGSYVLASGGTPGGVFGEIKNISGTTIKQLIYGTDTSPLAYGTTDHVKHFDCGLGDAVWTITVKVEDF